MYLRRLHSGDLPALMRLKDSAGWNQTEADWLTLLAIEPQGCFGIDVKGEIIASATVICYGMELAWIGMVLTAPAFRGQGLARRLMHACIDYAGARPIRLDASDMGHSLYTRLGFVDECPVERWLRPSIPQPTTQIPAQSPPFHLDVFYADRSPLLRRLAATQVVASAEGFALGRPGTHARYFGPCVASDPETARRLLQLQNEPIYWDLFPQHAEAVRLARENGFVLSRRLTRMVRSAPPALPHPNIYAIAGFEFG